MQRAARIIISVVLVLSAFATGAAAEMKVSFLYDLAGFTGIVRMSGAKISLDRIRKEIYVTSGDLIRVFNSSGMLIYSFGADLDVGFFRDAVTDEEGNIYVLSYWEGHTTITLCNFRGDPIRKIELTGLPKKYEGLVFDSLVYRKGTLYLAAQASLVVITTDANGVFKDGIELFPMLQIKSEQSTRRKKARDMEMERQDNEISGFDVDEDGNLIFTTPMSARAWVVSPDKKARYFGKSGSAPGRFAVPRGITRDGAGNFFVSDILRCVVLVFNKDFDFVTEFGGRGFDPGQLIGPTFMAVDGDSKLYVSSLLDKGVSVFKIQYN